MQIQLKREKILKNTFFPFWVKSMRIKLAGNFAMVIEYVFICLQERLKLPNVFKWNFPENTFVHQRQNMENSFEAALLLTMFFFFHMKFLD